MNLRCTFRGPCKNRATHVDELTEEPVCGPCYDTHVTGTRKQALMDTALTRAMELQVKETREVLDAV